MSINLINSFRYIIPGADNSIWLGRIPGIPINILADGWNVSIFSGQDFSNIGRKVQFQPLVINATKGWKTDIDIPSNIDELFRPFTIVASVISSTDYFNTTSPPLDLSEIYEKSYIAGLTGGLENL